MNDPFGVIHDLALVACLTTCPQVSHPLIYRQPEVQEVQEIGFTTSIEVALPAQDCLIFPDSGPQPDWSYKLPTSMRFAKDCSSGPTHIEWEWDREANIVVLRVKGHEPIVLKLDEVK